MNNYSNDFDPNDIRKKDMIHLAEHIENYLEVFESVMVIPKDVYKAKDVKEAIERTKRLCKKLRKGDISVFKDPDDFNSTI